jgi:superfamily II DNA or RNA helicase
MTSLPLVKKTEYEQHYLPGISLKNGFALRGGQRVFLEKLAGAFKRGESNHLGVFVPGYGKTITALASFVIANHLKVAQKLVIFVPRGNLRDQYADTKELSRVFANLGAPPFSFCVADSERVFLKNLQTRIIVTTYQYAAGKGGHRALQEFCNTAPCMFIFDEVHHLSEDGTWATKISQFPHVASVALSGTPLRSDNKTLFGVPFEVKAGADGNPEQYYVALHEVTLRDAHSEGKILKKVGVHVIDYMIKMARTDTGETVEMSLSKMMELTKNKNEVDAFLARKKMRFHEAYLHSLLFPAFEKFAEKRKALREELATTGKLNSGSRLHQMLIIAMSNKHAAAILDYIQINFPQYSSARIGQDIAESERLGLLNEYRNGSIDVMVQVDMIGEGTDIKPISVIIKADLVRAFSKTMQQVFRGMRYYGDWSEEANVCDIYAANDSDVVSILEWLSGEEQAGLKIKKLTEQKERTSRNSEPQASVWELQNVEQSGAASHRLELFPGFTEQPQIKIHTVKPEKNADANVIDVTAQEQELRQECALLAAKLAYVLKQAGNSFEVSKIHAEAKKRFSKAQEQMSLIELVKKRNWLMKCIAARRLV